MKLLNIIFLITLLILGYIVHSYIKSYNEIVNELKKIRLKCIHSKNDITELKKNKYKKNEENTEENTEEEIDEKQGENIIDDIPNSQLGDYDKRYNITRIGKNISNKKIADKNKLLLGIPEENDILNKSENSTTEDSEYIDFQELSRKKNDSYNKNNYNNKKMKLDNKSISETVYNIVDNETTEEYDQILEKFTDFQDQGELKYWKPYEEDIQKVSEGFVSCPYKGFNNELYEPLIINSNTIEPRGLNQSSGKIVNNQIFNKNKTERKGNQKQKWCLVDSVTKKCVQTENNQFCANKKTYDTQFQCQGYNSVKNI